MLDFILSNIGQGLIYAPMVLGVYITYKILDFPDLSVDGTFPLGRGGDGRMHSRGRYRRYWRYSSRNSRGRSAGYITGALHVYLK